MKFGFRKPSLRKSIAARTSPKRFIRQNLGIKAPRGMGLSPIRRRQCRTGFTVGRQLVYGILARSIDGLGFRGYLDSECSDHSVRSGISSGEEIYKSLDNNIPGMLLFL